MKYQLISENRNDKSTNTIERVLMNRGFKSKEEIQEYLLADDSSLISPFELDNMTRGIMMLHDHLYKSEDNLIMIQVDSDADGYTSAALLINFLTRIESDKMHKIYYVMHPNKEHGIDESKIKDGVSLVIAPDSSTNEGDIHKRLTERGIDVLVLDHHEADEMPPNYACIINNQLCDYPTKGLSGVGIVYKFCCGYESHYLGQGNYPISQSMIDIVALGIIGDMMDMKYPEIKRICDLGLEKEKITNPFFKTMVEVNSYSIGDTVTPIGVAFYVVPFINAVIRVGTQEEKEIIFKSMLDSEAYELVFSTKRGEKGLKEYLVTQACRSATNIKNRQAKARDAGMLKIQSFIEEKGIDSNNILIIPAEEQLQKTLTGLIANQLANKYQKPVLILKQRVHEEKGGEVWWEGSARGYDKSEVKNLKEFVHSTELVQYAEGHANAFGVGVRDADLENFITTSNKLLEGKDFSATYLIDFLLSPELYGDIEMYEIIEDICRYPELWGQGISEPYVGAQVLVKPKDVTLLGMDKKTPTIRIALNHDSNCAVVGIKFKASLEEYTKLTRNENGILLNIIGRCNMNSFRGVTTAQIKIENYEEVEIYDF